MADEKTRGYPWIPTSAWWALRKKFSQSMPGSINESYLATLLGTSQASAKKNVLAPLKQIGLLDESGKTTDLANRWRSDSEYPQVCDEIRRNIYPEEVLDLFSDTDADPNRLQSWFMSKARVGEVAAQNYTRFYFLLLEKDATQPTATSSTRATKVPAKAGTKTTARPQSRARAADKGRKDPARTGSDAAEAATAGESGTASGTQVPPQVPPEIGGKGLSLHIDIQIHISAEASPEQIDKIFESMAKHLPMNR